MDTKTAFQRSIDMASGVVTKITDSDWHNHTPCSEWDLHALVRHMLYELVWVPDMLAGKTVSKVGKKYDGDILGDHPIGNWQSTVIQVSDLVKKCSLDKVVHITAGDTSSDEYLREVAHDILIHGWDVAKSIGVTYDIPADLLAWAKNVAIILQERYGEFGVFGTPVDVPEDSSEQTKLLALLGRAA